MAVKAHDTDELCNLRIRKIVDLDGAEGTYSNVTANFTLDGQQVAWQLDDTTLSHR